MSRTVYRKAPPNLGLRPSDTKNAFLDLRLRRDAINRYALTMVPGADSWDQRK